MFLNSKFESWINLPLPLFTVIHPLNHHEFPPIPTLKSTTQIHFQPLIIIHQMPTNSTFTHNKPTKSNFFTNKFKLLFILFITMTTSFLLLFSFLSLSSVSSSHPHRHSGAVKAKSIQIQQACHATRYPDVCQSMIATSDPGPDPVGIIQAGFSSSGVNLNMGRGMVSDILSGSARDLNRSRAAQNCLELLSLSQHRLLSASNALSREKVRDARAWTSAALSYQYDCWSALKYVNDSSLVNSTMSFFDTTLIVSVSNTLSMLRSFDVFGPNLSLWAPPRTERYGFWEPVTGSGNLDPGIDVDGLMVNAVVCKDGLNGCFKSVQAAVDSATENLRGNERYVIKIREGVYEETVRVWLNKSNLVFLGDGIGKTVITGSISTGIQGITTYNTATVGILGDGFIASGLTFENTAGPDAHQAVAFRSDSDFSYITNCEFLGNQDTIYIHSLRQLFKSCLIQGNVDFIFGNAAAIFQDCTILIRPRQLKPESGETNAIAAVGRTDPAQTTGFAFLNCLINGTEEYVRLYNAKPSKHKNYLGRPWKMYSRTVYINCTLESLIAPQGWLPWSGDFALSTLYYGEFGNLGPGADVANRVSWSRQIPEEHVSTFYAQNFLQGDEWITTAS